MMREFVTEILDDSQKSAALTTVVQFLSDRGVETVKVEFGFVYGRDLRGQEQGEDAVVPLAELHPFIERGLQEGTIEWDGSSDFVLGPVGLQLNLKLCNDSDLHLLSTEASMLIALSRALIGVGIKVYDSGKIVVPDTWR